MIVLKMAEMMRDNLYLFILCGVGCIFNLIILFLIFFDSFDF
ncbi:hypothetical protein [Clostridium sp.]|nr:hypothetical protein [Clostridium sp.]MDO5040236.1 hypothetical protein [Clostridium sp.]